MRDDMAVLGPLETFGASMVLSLLAGLALLLKSSKKKLQIRDFAAALLSAGLVGLFLSMVLWKLLGATDEGRYSIIALAGLAALAGVPASSVWQWCRAVILRGLTNESDKQKKKQRRNSSRDDSPQSREKNGHDV